VRWSPAWESVRVHSRVESPETAVRRVGGWCEMAGSLGISTSTVESRESSDGT
jgi:hypothetical protein